MYATSGFCVPTHKMEPERATQHSCLYLLSQGSTGGDRCGLNKELVGVAILGDPYNVSTGGKKWIFVP